jgi:hypothetical protein
LKSPLTNPEGKSLMANHSLFKLSVVALLVSTLAACGKTEDAPAAQLTVHRLPPLLPQRQRPRRSAQLAGRGLQRPTGSAYC